MKGTREGDAPGAAIARLEKKVLNRAGWRNRAIMLMVACVAAVVLLMVTGLYSLGSAVRTEVQGGAATRTQIMAQLSAIQAQLVTLERDDQANASAIAGLDTQLAALQAELASLTTTTTRPTTRPTTPTTRPAPLATTTTTTRPRPSTATTSASVVCGLGVLSVCLVP